MSDYNREGDKAWARQIIDIWMREWNLTNEAADELAEKLADAFQTVRQSSESIGDIQVKDELYDKGERRFKVYVNGKDSRYYTQDRDIGILLGLGEKYLGHGNGRDFAKYGGRMLGIEDGWTK